MLKYGLDHRLGSRGGGAATRVEPTPKRGQVIRALPHVLNDVDVFARTAVDIVTRAAT